MKFKFYGPTYKRLSQTTNNQKKRSSATVDRQILDGMELPLNTNDGLTEVWSDRKSFLLLIYHS